MTIECCNNILKLNSCTMIKDFSALSNIQTLSIIEMGVSERNLSLLSNVKTLKLTGNMWNKIENVSMLGHIHTLDLSGCYRIEDVSALGNVHTLNLSKTNIPIISIAQGDLNKRSFISFQNIKVVISSGSPCSGLFPKTYFFYATIICIC